MGTVIPVVWPRAVVVWALTRLLVAALPLATGGGFGSIPAPPVGIILLAGFVGIIDVGIRGEGILWANLGVPRNALYAVYAMAAVPGELVLAVALR
jgi:hypothetical protein